jgi:predicted flap endonuclease-1-like 5' DNA nuclease
MLTPEDKKELLRKRGEGLHQWVLRINGYFSNMTPSECSTALFNVVQEAYNTGAKERGKSGTMSSAKHIKLSGTDKKPKAKAKEKEEQEEVTIDSSIIDKMDMPVTLTGISIRARNVLKKAGITTLGEIVQYSREDLRNLRGAGTAFVFEIESMLDEYGLNLKGTVMRS